MDEVLVGRFKELLRDAYFAAYAKEEGGPGRDSYWECAVAMTVEDSTVRHVRLRDLGFPVLGIVDQALRDAGCDYESYDPPKTPRFADLRHRRNIMISPESPELLSKLEQAIAIVPQARKKYQLRSLAKLSASMAQNEYAKPNGEGIIEKQFAVYETMSDERIEEMTKLLHAQMLCAFRRKSADAKSNAPSHTNRKMQTVIAEVVGWLRDQIDCDQGRVLHSISQPNAEEINIFCKDFKNALLNSRSEMRQNLRRLGYSRQI